MFRQFAAEFGYRIFISYEGCRNDVERFTSEFRNRTAAFVDKRKPTFTGK